MLWQISSCELNHASNTLRVGFLNPLNCVDSVILYYVVGPSRVTQFTFSHSAYCHQPLLTRLVAVILFTRFTVLIYIFLHKIVFNVLLIREVSKREAFWWHAPSFISSEFGHVTPPLSRGCCRQRGGCDCLCHGWVWGIWTGSGLFLGRLYGTNCYCGLESWCSGSLPCAYYTPYGGQPGMFSRTAHIPMLLSLFH